ncbi:hypothetical protein GYMLUDRAFT_43039 [Collybiopsis luxurians FD-317 M1]|uniref:Uncharacterized protein n=1 Tax=Collybiopsis luxurians FD-317 M1 TaxID=944289 RepID=A0A0D0CQW0_9AGAR|nr:hypothetical protein GYMLUDRAFT_43039 [Collybiopsis luxurians FD-317 M1]
MFGPCTEHVTAHHFLARRRYPLIDPHCYRSSTAPTSCPLLPPPAHCSYLPPTAPTSCPVSPSLVWTLPKTIISNTAITQ